MNLKRAAVVIGLMALSMSGLAQEKREVREHAKTQAEKLRQRGEPMDRCSLRSRVADGAVIVDVDVDSSLRRGDRLLTLNKIDVAGKTGDEVVQVLRGIAPDTTLEIEVLRDTGQTSVSLVCANARPISETILEGLDAAARGKFEDCESAFGRRNDLGALGANMKWMCVAVGKEPDDRKLGRLAHEALRLSIAEANWVPAFRPGLIDALRGNETLITRALGSGRYQELVLATQQWPGGEDMFRSSTPDMLQFRRAAEQALRSRLIDPDSARIEWPYGFVNGYWKPPFQKRIDGYWTCGLINARNRMGGYTGTASFVVVLNSAGLVQFVDIGSGGDFDLVSSQCSNSVKTLPAAPREFGSGRSQSNGSSTSSGSTLADELKKLSDLRESGALTDTEFQAAKSRLLSESGP